MSLLAVYSLSDSHSFHRSCYLILHIAPRHATSSAFAFSAMYTILLSLLALSGTSIARPDVFFIRHGEKPGNGGIGLSDDGVERAECIRDIFGDHSSYNIGYILAQKPKKSTYLHCVQNVDWTLCQTPWIFTTINRG